MTLTAAILLLCSAFTHAGWNLLGKKSRRTAAGFLTASLLGLIIFIPFIILYGKLLKQFPADVWYLLLLTGFFQAVYYGSLAMAYRHGDMSIAYPLARSLPAVFVGLFALLMGRGAAIGPAAWFGIGLIVLGSQILPMRHRHDFSLKKFANRNILFALLASLGTTGYSITDDRALALVRAGLAGAPGWQGSVVYAFFEGVFSFCWLLLFLLLRKNGREDLKLTLRSSLWSSLTMGLGIYLTYSIVLVSMAFVADVSYVVAFRQASIPIGVILGVLLLKEKGTPARFIGVSVMFGGLILVGMG